MRTSFFLVVAFLIASMFLPTLVVAAPAATGTLVVSVADSRRAALSGASVRLTGPAAFFLLATNPHGISNLAVPPGLYRVVVSRPGFESVETDDLAVASGTSTNVTVTLNEATSTTLREIGRVRATRQNSLNTSVSAVSVLASAQLGEKVYQDLNKIVTELPGVTLTRGSASPNSYFVVRGGYTETRVEIDGHPISTGASGTYNSAFASSLAFSSIEVTKGAGLFGPAAGESAFGTVNLRTPDFRTGNSVDVALGADSFGGQYSTYSANVNLLKGERLSLIGVKTIFGFRGVADTIGASHAFSPTLPLINWQGDYGAREYTGSELVKARYRFSESTSLSLEYLGLQGGFLPQGSSYGSFVGNKTIAACLNGSQPSFDVAGCNQYSGYNAPSAQGLVGQTVPLYTWFPNSTVRNNEPIFSAEFRTNVRNDTVLVRPYRAIINRFTDGSGEVVTPGDSGLWYQVSNPASCQPTFVAPNASAGTTARGPCFVGTNTTPITTALAPCSAAALCYTTPTARDNHGTLAYGKPFSQAEQDRLSGVTFNYIHPVGQNLYTLGYEYSSDDTLTYTGDTSALPPGVNYTVGGGSNGPATPIGVPPTKIRKNDLSLTGQFQLSPGLQLAVGNYLTFAKLDYQIEDPVVFAASQANSPVALLGRSRSVAHYDPHIGLTYRPNPETILRLSAGSAITIPYAGQISGLESFTFPGPGNNNVGNFSLRNPDLRPETTIAYNVGADVRTRAGGILSVDLFHNTIHDVFINNRIDYTPPTTFISTIPGARYTQTLTINGPIERNYGLELSLAKRPVVGFGYYLSTAIQRAYLDQLPASLYANQLSSLINGQQLSGQSGSSPFGSPPAIVPYVTAYGELRFAGQKNSLFTIGLTYTSANNPTYGPAYTQFNSTLRLPLGSNYQFQMAADNIFNYTGGTTLNTATFNGGFAQILYGAPRPGDPPVFSSRGVALQPLTPRVIRFQVSRHFGR